MNDTHSDALVFSARLGICAYKRSSRRCRAMVKRGHLNVPVIAVARDKWTRERKLHARAHDSLVQHGGVDPEAFAKLSWARPLCRRRLY